MTDVTAIENKEKVFGLKKTVYGPVRSWRFGESLGIDPIYEISTCSFNCIYCQLGNIQNITAEVKEYVPTEKVKSDFIDMLKSGKNIDVITYSGSGEPTLASNLGEMAIELKKLAPNIPQLVLTNATLLSNKTVQKNLENIDKVIIKLDAGTEATFKLINRPVKGVSLESTVAGIKEFRKNYRGMVEVQSMFMPVNIKELEEYAKILIEISPDIVQLNTPKRPYPTSWHRENRGNHLGLHDHKTKMLKTVTIEEAKDLEVKLRGLTKLEIVSIYRK